MDTSYKTLSMLVYYSTALMSCIALNEGLRGVCAWGIELKLVILSVFLDREHRHCAVPNYYYQVFLRRDVLENHCGRF